MKVQRAEYSMSGDEIFAFVRRLLETDEELHVLRKSYGCPDGVSTPTVRAIQVEQSDRRRDGQGAAPSPSTPWSHSDRGYRSKGKGNSPRGPPSGKGGSKPGKGNQSPGSSSQSHGGKGRGKPASAGSPGLVCFTCRDLGKPHDHVHFNCTEWQAKRAGRGDGASSSNSPRKSE
jgi:hypothetical protein